MKRQLSVRPSVCMSVPSAARGGFAAGRRACSRRRGWGAAAANLPRSQCGQCHVDSWRTRLNSDLLQTLRYFLTTCWTIVHRYRWNSKADPARGKGVRRILVRGVNAWYYNIEEEGYSRRRVMINNNNNNNNHQLDQPIITRITSPPPPFRKLLFFVCFRFLILYFFIHFPEGGGSADPIYPYVQTPMARGSLLGDRWFRTNPLERAFRHLVEIHCYLDSKLPHTTVTHLSFTPICDCRIAAYFACCCIFRIFRKVRISHIFPPQKIGIFDGNFSYFNIFVFLFESAGLLNLWGLCITFDRHKHWYRVVIRKFPPNCLQLHACLLS